MEVKKSSFILKFPRSKHNQSNIVGSRGIVLAVVGAARSREWRSLNTN